MSQESASYADEKITGVTTLHMSKEEIFNVSEEVKISPKISKNSSNSQNYP